LHMGGHMLQWVVSEYRRVCFRQVAAWARKVTADAVRFAYVWSGAEGFRGSTAIGRMFCYTFVATQHVYVDPITLVDAAPGILNQYRRSHALANQVLKIMTKRLSGKIALVTGIAGSFCFICLSYRMTTPTTYF
jgi:hypothetical protein